MKLVSLKVAAIGQTPGFDRDIRQLGETMLRIATNPNPPNPNIRDVESLKTYDPSLYFLIKWMTSESLPTMHEVLRHPYFMSTTERKAFGLALGGGMIGAFLSDDANPSHRATRQRDQAIVDAVGHELKNHLDKQLRQMLVVTKSHVASAAEAGDVVPAVPTGLPDIETNDRWAVMIEKFIDAPGEIAFCNNIHSLLSTHFRMTKTKSCDFRKCSVLRRLQHPKIESPYFGTPIHKVRKAIDILKADAQRRFQIVQHGPAYFVISLAPA